jgi:DNA-binding CsgD family transcriptional regulator
MIDNDLADFLTSMIALRTSGDRADARAQKAIGAYYAFLERVGIEHCNFGGFAIDSDGTPSINQFSGTRLPGGFIEEFTEEMAIDDYVLRRAELLDGSCPVARFRTGLPVLDEIEAFHAPSRKVQVECARHGIEEGVALIGNTALAAGGQRAADGGRYFGFVFAGEEGTMRVVEERGAAIEIAAFALLDQIMPQIEASIDGFSDTLTARERDVLAALASGAIRKQIAFDLDIAVPTVDMHIAAIKRKLNAATLPEAVARACRYDLL